MDITKMLAELKTERQQVEEAIMVLERIAVGRGRRRLQAARLDDSREAARQTKGE